MSNNWGKRTDNAVARYKREENQRNLDQIIDLMTPLIRNIASKFNQPVHVVEDLMQEGSLGVMDALSKFDMETGFTFSTYAHKFIYGRMQHYLRDHHHPIRYPAWIQEFHSRRMRLMERFRRDFKREPQEFEIAKLMKLDYADYETKLQALTDAGKIVASYEEIQTESDITRVSKPTENTGWYTKHLWSGVTGDAWEKPSFLMVLFNEALSMRSMGASVKEIEQHFQLPKAKAKKLVAKLDEYREKQNELVSA